MASYSKNRLLFSLQALSACGLMFMFHGCSLFESKPKVESTTSSASVVSSSADASAGPVYATIGNEEKPFITKKEFDVKLDQMLQMYRGQITADALPVEAKRKFLDDLIKMRTISAVWADNRDVASESNFQKMLQERIDAAKESAIVEFFVQELREGITVSDGEISSDYKKNKDRYIKVAGGAALQAISFDNEDDAKKFLKSVKNDAKDFEERAKEESKAHYKNFGFVSQAAQDPQMGMMPNTTPEFLKTAVFESKKFPVIDMVSNGQKFWVYCATDHKASEYFALDEIKDQLKEMIKETKFKTVLEDRLKDLVDKARIKINEEYFQRQAPSSKQPKQEEEKDGSDADGVIAA